MKKMKYLGIAAAVTLTAGLVPLALLPDPVGIFIATVSLSIAFIGIAVTTTIYFMREAAAALTFREEDFYWH